MKIARTLRAYAITSGMTANRFDTFLEKKLDTYNYIW